MSQKNLWAMLINYISKSNSKDKKEGCLCILFCYMANQYNDKLAKMASCLLIKLAKYV